MIIESCVTYKADTDTNKKKITKAMASGVGVDVKISKTDSSCCEKWCFFVWCSHESCTKKYIRCQQVLLPKFFLI